MPTKRERFLDVDFDVMPIDELLARVGSVQRDTPLQYVVTPNVDHVVRLHNRQNEFPSLSEMYRKADLCVCDSKVLSLLAKWRGLNLPVTVGTDLAELVFERLARDGDHIAVIGGDALLFRELRQKFPNLSFAQHLPPMGLTRDAEARRTAAEFIVREKPRFTFICVGSPQQEMIAAEAASMPGSGGIAFCVGAALEFITDRQRRAPKLARRLGLEWAHRLAMNPRRLWRRYLIKGPAIFLLAYRWRKRAA
jgi:N-acetylglucosaminyldiphosphoundecaprenol N-acetyl-beta-D-mannosaminyltransferase